MGEGPSPTYLLTPQADHVLPNGVTPYTLLLVPPCPVIMFTITIVVNDTSSTSITLTDYGIEFLFESMKNRTGYRASLRR